MTGWFGEYCDRKCPKTCKCDQESRNCTGCVAGWFGAECESPCSLGCKEGNCQKNGSCAQGCKPGSYGARCEFKCSLHCVFECDQLSGECVQCEAGWHGPTCQFKCSDGCVGIDKICDIDGICSDGCAEGYFGEKCEFSCPQQCFRCHLNGTCSTCKNGFFQRPCHRCKESVCNQTTGACTKGCQSGNYGLDCTKTCGTCMDRVCNQTTGVCTKGCQSGNYGSDCTKTCDKCKDRVCNGTTGECVKGCENGYFGPFCYLTCENCEDGDCDIDTGECTHKDEKEDELSYGKYLIGGGVAIVIIIIIMAAGLFCMSNRLKRINGVMYDIVKWRRDPPSDEDIPPVIAPERFEPPMVCPIVSFRQTSYIEPRHGVGSGNDVQIQPQLQVAGLSDQEADKSQTEAAPLSDRLLENVLLHSDEWSYNRDGYVLPHYCEVNEVLMATLPHAPQGAEAPAPVVQNSLFSVVADVHAQVGCAEDVHALGEDISIPLIAEYFRATKAEDSPPADVPQPNVENYNHPFRDHYVEHENLAVDN